MRTTIRVDDQLLAEAKKIAAKSGKTMSVVLEDAIRESFLRRRHQTREPVDLPVFTGNGLQPGVDLDDSAALLDLMDGLHDPA